ncbi:hypothetical protein DFJ74DRAFT_710187 [Hyaloraphidium curvatum]|nr:hypothetical protein DFJ74DRAFT_710187 [Hyaloraphidium curvatum]
MPAVTPGGAERPAADLHRPDLHQHPKSHAGDAFGSEETDFGASGDLLSVAEHSGDAAGPMAQLLPTSPARAGAWHALIGTLCRTPRPRGHGPCVLRGPRALSASGEVERTGVFELLSLPSDILPLVFRYLFDCELGRLSEASKASYRVCLPEFAFRVRRIETPEALRNVKRPRRTVVEEHKKMKILHMSLAGSPVKHVVVCHRKGFPRATLNGCKVQ